MDTTTDTTAHDEFIRNREYPPDRIRGIYTAWLNNRNGRIQEYKHWEAMLGSEYWEKVADVRAGRYGHSNTESGHTWIEVNNLYPFIMSYISALHDPDQDVSIRRGTGITGDADKAYETLRTWRHQIHVVQTIQQSDLLATLYDGCAAKVWYDMKRRDPLRRVLVKIIPWWEVMPDEGVTNTSDADFVAHCYWMPVTRARKMFMDNQIKGVPIGADRMVVKYRADDTPAGDAQTNYTNMVRVVEFYNLRDDYFLGESDPTTGLPVHNFSPSPDTTHETGRVDYFLPDESSGWRYARRSLPFQLRDVNNDPVLPIKVYCLMSRPGYPYVGQAQTPRVVDLCREMNISRSAQATATRRDNPQVICPNDFFDEAAEAVLRRGDYAGFAKYDPKYMDGDPKSKVWVLDTGNLPYDHTLYRQEIGKDIERASLQPPATRGRVTGATATEVLEADKGGKGELAVLATNRKVFLTDLYSTVLLAIQKSVQSDGANKNIAISVGPGQQAKIIEVTADDLNGDFYIEVNDGEPTVIHEERMLQRFLSFAGAWLPLAKEYLTQPNETVATIMDEMVKRSGMPDVFLTRNMRGAAPKEGAEIPRGPGAGSAVPGAASRPAVGTGEPSGAGGPQPESPQPPGIETGVIQNGVTIP